MRTPTGIFLLVNTFVRVQHCAIEGFNIVHEVAVGQNQWYHFGVGAPPILVYFSGDWDVHWGLTGLLTHGEVCLCSFGIGQAGREQFNRMSMRGILATALASLSCFTGIAKLICSRMLRTLSCLFWYAPVVWPTQMSCTNVLLR